MSRILLSWELGDNLGHFQKLRLLGERLERNGHKLAFCVKDHERAHAQLGRNARIVSAPQPDHDDARDNRPVISYTEILQRQGYADPATLDGLLEQWDAIFRAVQPDLLIADHAPTALLAARIAGVPAAVIGVGFLVPPRVSPMPPLQWWRATPGRARLRRLERDVLGPVNQVLSQRGCAPLTQVADVLDVPVRALLTVPALDDYPRRPATESYYGILRASGNGHTEPWPGTGEPRVFGYLRAQYPGLRNLLHALDQLPVQALLCVPDCPDALCGRNAGERITVVREPLEMSRYAVECDVAVSYASAGFVSEMMAHGKPMFLLPPTLHHAMLAKRMQKAGAATIGTPMGTVMDYRAAIRRLLDEPGHARAAGAVAAEIRQYPQGDAVLDRIVSEVEDLL